MDASRCWRPQPANLERPRLLGLVRPCHSAVIRIETAPFFLSEIYTDPASFSNVAESARPHALLLDAEACDARSALCFARSLWRDATLLVVTPYWYEDDADLRPLCDAMLHVPVRRREWRRALMAAAAGQLTRPAPAPR